MIASQLPDSSWFGPLEPERANRPPQQNPALARLWRSFMTGRAVVAVLLLLLQAGIYLLGAGGGRAPLVLCVGYLAATLLVRLFARPRAPGRNFDRQWVYTIGGDVAVFYSSSVVAPTQCSSPRASAGLSILPAPTIVCSSSMKTMVLPASCAISFSTDLRRSSNSPRYLAPARSAAMSR